MEKGKDKHINAMLDSCSSQQGQSYNCRFSSSSPDESVYKDKKMTTVPKEYFSKSKQCYVTSSLYV